MKRTMVWMPVLAGCVMMGAGLARDARAQAASSPNTQSMSPARQPQPPVTGAAAAVPQPTGQCRDGSLWTGATKTGACKGHKGLKVWFADVAPQPAQSEAPPRQPQSPPAPPPPLPSEATPRQTQTPPAVPSAPTAKGGPAGLAAAKKAAPGGGPGLVWLNTNGNTYHCYGSTYYGKTAHGAYMSETDAKAKGGHPARGQACSK